MEQPMQPNKNGQASHTMWIRFPESKTRVHPKDMALNSLSSVDLIMIQYITNKNGITTAHLVENSIRLLTGDEECDDLFSDLIDPVICEVLNIDQINSLRLEINLNWKEIQGGKFYGDKVLSCGHGLSTSRNIKGFSMIPGCLTAEFLDASHLIVESLTSVNSKNLILCYIELQNGSIISLPVQPRHLSRVFLGSEYLGWGT